MARTYRRNLTRYWIESDGMGVKDYCRRDGQIRYAPYYLEGFGWEEGGYYNKPRTLTVRPIVYEKARKVMRAWNDENLDRCFLHRTQRRINKLIIRDGLEEWEYEKGTSSCPKELDEASGG